MCQQASAAFCRVQRIIIPQLTEIVNFLFYLIIPLVYQGKNDGDCHDGDALDSILNFAVTFTSGN